METMKGKKTYVIAALAGVLSIAQSFAIIPQDIVMELYGLLGAGGLAALRAGVESGKKDKK